MNLLGILPWEYLGRMALAALLGGVIGYERKSRMKEAGVRTHLIVALASALMMLVSKYGFYDVVVFDSITLDASRIAANIITGVNFLGAGVIFANGRSVLGLTTAAGVWATSGVGIAIGAGMYGVGISAALMILLIQVILHRHFPFLENPAPEQITVTVEEGGKLRALEEELLDHGVEILSLKARRNPSGSVTAEVSLRAGRDSALRGALACLEENPSVLEVQL